MRNRYNYKDRQLSYLYLKVGITKSNKKPGENDTKGKRNLRTLQLKIQFDSLTLSNIKYNISF